MKRAAIVDTGPLVAFLDRGERRHAWVAERIRELEAPLLVCEPVLTEASYLLSGSALAQDALLGLLGSGAVRIGMRLEDHAEEIRALLKKYRDQRMSFADACVVRMAEIHERHCIFTLDSDFRVYRRNGRQALDLISPASK